MVSFTTLAQVKVEKTLKATHGFETTESSHCDGPHGYTICKSLTASKGDRSCKMQIAGSNFEVEDNEEFTFGKLEQVGNGVEARAHKFSRLKIICNFIGEWKDVAEVLSQYFEDPTKQTTKSGKALSGGAKRVTPAIRSLRLPVDTNKQDTNND